MVASATWMPIEISRRGSYHAVIGCLRVCFTPPPHGVQSTVAAYTFKVPREKGQVGLLRRHLIRPAPPPIAPRRVPMCAVGQGARHEIEPVRPPGVTAHDARERHPRAGP